MGKSNLKKKINFRQIDVAELVQIINNSKRDKTKLNNLYILSGGELLMAAMYKFHLDDMLNKTWFKKEIIDRTCIVYTDEEVHGVTLHLLEEK